MILEQGSTATWITELVLQRFVAKWTVGVGSDQTLQVSIAFNEILEASDLSISEPRFLTV